MKYKYKKEIVEPVRKVKKHFHFFLVIMFNMMCDVKYY